MQTPCTLFSALSASAFYHSIVGRDCNRASFVARIQPLYKTQVHVVHVDTRSDQGVSASAVTDTDTNTRRRTFSVRYSECIFLFVSQNHTDMQTPGQLAVPTHPHSNDFIERQAHEIQWLFDLCTNTHAATAAARTPKNSLKISGRDGTDTMKCPPKEARHRGDPHRNPGARLSSSVNVCRPSTPPAWQATARPCRLLGGLARDASIPVERELACARANNDARPDGNVRAILLSIGRSLKRVHVCVAAATHDARHTKHP